MSESESRRLDRGCRLLAGTSTERRTTWIPSINLRDRGGCPLCQTPAHAVVMPFPDIPVVQCCRCGFTYSSKVLSGQELTSYYEDNFGSQRHLQGQIVNSLVNAMVLEKLVDFRAVRNILDVGTGYGFLLKELSRRRQLECTGVELSRQEAEYARNALGLNVTNALLRDSGLKKESYDLVTSFEVIEHVPLPIEFISESIDYVKPGGYLLVMTDNFGSRLTQSLGAGFPKWIPHSHISHFSSETLSRTLRNTKKLELVKSVTYTPWELSLRNMYYKVRGIKKTPSEAFDLKSTLQDEMQGKYKCFALRKMFNEAWARLRLSSRMDGEAMYFLCRKIA